MNKITRRELKPFDSMEELFNHYVTYLNSRARKNEWENKIISVPHVDQEIVEELNITATSIFLFKNFTFGFASFAKNTNGLYCSLMPTTSIAHPLRSMYPNIKEILDSSNTIIIQRGTQV